MSLAGTSARIVVIGEMGATQEQISSALNTQTEFELVDVLSDNENVIRDLHLNEPDIILVDHQFGGEPTLDIIDDISHQFPTASIIAILPNDETLAAQQVTLAGARAFIVQPFTQVNLLSTLRRVRDLQLRHRQVQGTTSATAQEGPPPVKTFSVFSPRGGVGCTSLASNLAIALHEQTGERVLLMEGKLIFGHLDVMLNIRSRSTLADLIPHHSNLDDMLVREVVVEHVSGIHVLLAPTDFQLSQGIRPQELFNIIISLQRMFDYIVIDAGSTMNENTVTLLDSSDRILLVTNPDMAALHDVSRFIRISQSLAYPAEKILIVLNRAGRDGGIKTKDIDSVLRQQVFAHIADDGANTLRSINRGIPLLLRNPRSPASKSYVKLAKSLVIPAPEGQPQAIGDQTPVYTTEQVDLASG